MKNEILKIWNIRNDNSMDETIFAMTKDIITCHINNFNSYLKETSDLKN